MTWILDSSWALLLALDAADSDDDGRVIVSDALFTIRYALLGDPAPPPPFPECGQDP